VHLYGGAWNIGIIANLLMPDALRYFYLENKNTRLLYVNTCFLGGENLLKFKKS